MSKKLKLAIYDCKTNDLQATAKLKAQFDGKIFIVLGNVKYMNGHVYCQDIKTGISAILEKENMIFLKKNEV